MSIFNIKLFTKKKEDKKSCQGCIYLDMYNTGEAFCAKGESFGRTCIKSNYKFREVNAIKEVVVPEITSNCYSCVNFIKNNKCELSAKEREDCLNNNHKVYKCVDIDSYI